MKCAAGVGLQVDMTALISSYVGRVRGGGRKALTVIFLFLY